MPGIGNHGRLSIHNPKDAAHPLPFSKGRLLDTFLEVSDCYCCFYWLGHFESSLSRDFHLMDVPGVELYVLD